MFRKTYKFTVAMEHKESVFSIMEMLKIRKFSMTVTEDLDILVRFKANEKEVHKVIDSLNKYNIGKARLV